ncbi:MAG: TRAP transporter substrate-binding protein [bacterium]
MTGRKLICSLLVCAASLCFSSSVLAQDKTLKLKYSNFFPPVHPISKLSEEWCKAIEKATEGRVTFSYFPGSTLTPPMQTYDSVVKGIVDVGQSLLAYAPGRLPLSGVLTLPLGYKSGSQATRLSQAYYKQFKPKEFDDVQVMYLHGHGPGFFHTKKLISTVEEVKGLRIKANAENAEIVSAFGGAPVTLPITETYDALQKGLLDGVLLPFEALKGWKFAEVVKCSVENYGVSYTSPIYVIMNKEKWNSISEADRKAIERINEQWNEKQAQLWDELDKEAKEFAIQKGVKVVGASKEEQAKTAEKMKPILDNWVKNMSAKGLPAKEALEFCQEYLRKNP